MYLKKVESCFNHWNENLLKLLTPTLLTFHASYFKDHMKNLKFEIKFLNPKEKIPPQQEVSAVFLIALKDTSIIVIRNHRGWDIPAGHLEEKEGILEALQREAREEASMTYTHPIPFVLVFSDSEEQKYKGKCMIGFTTKEFELNDFVSAPDSSERKIMSIEEFLSLYEHDKMGMRSMIEKAHEILSDN